ncbi:hypothetical protein ELH39_08010 [Rhizobium ruizarguesonis]|uniref:hypothetical protein n=1 Tax=Rhizobium ruizarguesonis TaxID=2081791 RepID=UPI00102F8E95|nr:hypothetical protein [Rhizobium ruizarguesonis]TBB97190.1 hypothetical protein ELH39_08010 [Rhizobium ruizarguesonis]
MKEIIISLYFLGKLGKLILEYSAPANLKRLHDNFLERKMSDFLEVINAVGSLTPERLTGLVALAAIGLSGFAIYVVHSVIKDRDKGSK